MKICHVITRMIVGGAQENTLLSIIGQLEKGHEAVLLTGPSPGREGELLKNADFPDFEVVQTPHLVRELSPVCDVKAYFALKKFFRERKFDVVHTHSSKAGIVGRFAAHAAGVPVVVHTVHGLAFGRYEKPWRNLLYRFSERCAARVSDRIFAVARSMVEQCVAGNVAPESKFRVVYSGMDMDAFLNAAPDAKLRHALGIPERVPVIATLARLFRMKGYEFVLPSACEVLKSRPDTHFLIIGDGPMKDELETRLRELAIEKNFHFAGLIPPEKVPRYLALADLLWHLSLREGLPRSVVQALACGKPAVGFALDGTPEVIEDRVTGILARPENVGDVVRGTLELLSDPEAAAKMGEAGRERVRGQFEWRNMAETLLEEYSGVLAQKTK